MLGIPSDWSKIDLWLNFKPPISVKVFVATPLSKLKNPEIPILKSYSKAPPESFWSKFPKKNLTTIVETPINVGKLESLVEENSKKLTSSQLLRAAKCIRSLREGASSYQKGPLPSIFQKNAPSAEKYGELMTDTIASWVKKGFVSGPFAQPPLKNFRVNPLMAIEQHGKIRPVLNVSEPVGRSFNDNVVGHELEKVYMDSAKDFGYCLCKAGQSAIFSKFDMSDAYKNIPCKTEDLHLQGFSWLGKFFVEEKQPFGAKSSVINYDMFGHTVEDVAVVASGTPADMTMRRLDDVPSVGTEKSGHCEKFSETYSSICNQLNIKLAPDCPLNEKAFRNVKRGRVLGIDFHSEDLSWSLPSEKKERCLRDIQRCLEEGSTSLLEMQKLLGRLSDVCQMCPFMRIFKKPLNDILSKLQTGQNAREFLSEAARVDLLTWAGMLSDNCRFPIPREPTAPPLRHIHLSTDAAGVAEGEKNEGAGVGGVALDEEGEILFCYQHLWDKEMIEEKKDNKGARFGAKTSTLEMIGMILPFILFPSSLKNRHVILSTDNIGCFFGWENMAVKGDVTASILVRSLALMSAKLNCHVYVEHVPRCSTWGSKMADCLSRSETTKGPVKRLLRSFSQPALPLFLTEWLKDPKEDWSLALMCTNFVSI